MGRQDGTERNLSVPPLYPSFYLRGMIGALRLSCQIEHTYIRTEDGHCNIKSSLDASKDPLV